MSDTGSILSDVGSCRISLSGSDQTDLMQIMWEQKNIYKGHSRTEIKVRLCQYMEEAE